MADRHKFVVFPSINHIIKCRSYRLCRCWPFRPSDRPDIEQSMRLHLIERWPRYDSDRGTPQMFVEAALSNWELQQLRNARRLKRRPYHLAMPLYAAPESQLVSRDWREADERLEACELLRRCLGLLSPDEQDLLRLVSEHGERHAAEALSLTRHQVRQRLGLIRAWCRNLKETDQNPDRP